MREVPVAGGFPRRVVFMIVPPDHRRAFTVIKVIMGLEDVALSRRDGEPREDHVVASLGVVATEEPGAATVLGVERVRTRHVTRIFRCLHTFAGRLHPHPLERDLLAFKGRIGDKVRRAQN